MELTIEQALQQGVAAHKEGKLQEAERLYRAILQSQPLHPDANHNLGVLAVSVNKAGEALPLFKTALDANPKVEQFWLSYIDALVREQHYDTARQVIAEGRTQGHAEDKLKALEARLTSSADGKVPPQAQLDNLLKYYQAGQHGDAEKLALSITEEFPEYPLGWQVLGAVLKQTGRVDESLVASQNSVHLAPEDPHAHNNLGIIFKDLGRLKEAEASLRQAIALKSDLAEAHNNLGNTLNELARLEEAEKSLRQALALKIDYAKAQNNLGNTLKDRGKLEEAEASLRRAVALKPEYAEAHFNLGIMLLELSRLDEAEASFRRVIELKPDYADVHNKLLKCLFLQDKQSYFYDELNYLINQGEVNSVIGSLVNRSALKYGMQKPNLFCEESLKYVLHIDLNNRYDFRELFVKNTRSILEENRISNRKQVLLVNGTQTSGNLFIIEKFLTKKIQKIIRSEIEKYKIYFKDSQEGLIKKWPSDYDLYGWIVSMKSDGELQPHIHDKGWLSGTIYINIPPKLNADSGNLVVSLGDEKDLRDKRINLKEVIDVATGSLVIFPSSLTHYTIPFKSEEERIVLAFDVIPK